MESDPGGGRSRTPWWVWVILALFGLIVVLYLLLDALAGTHGVRS
jgi:hypothetical protein